jgi:hypothetical protein
VVKLPVLVLDVVQGVYCVICAHHVMLAVNVVVYVGGVLLTRGLYKNKNVVV